MTTERDAKSDDQSGLNQWALCYLAQINPILLLRVRKDSRSAPGQCKNGT